jgi:hypothetical protein
MLYYMCVFVVVVGKEGGGGFVCPSTTTPYTHKYLHTPPQQPPSLAPDDASTTAAGTHAAAERAAYEEMDRQWSLLVAVEAEAAAFNEREELFELQVNMGGWDVIYMRVGEWV